METTVKYINDSSIEIICECGLKHIITHNQNDELEIETYAKKKKDTTEKRRILNFGKAGNDE